MSVEAYKLTLVLVATADVGMFKGALKFFFSKLATIFEPNSLVQVHGFDWFKGTNPHNETRSRQEQALNLFTTQAIKIYRVLTIF